MNESHKSFIKSLVFCAIVTIVSMVFARILITNYIITPSFTSQKSQSLMDD
jgi:hypothetical protein